jgi:hypothetical protein
MNLQKSYTQEYSHIDNFSVRSKGSEHVMWEPKEDRIRKREKTVDVGRNKSFYINGVDFHAQEIVVQRQGEMLEDAYSVKGEYFYLKRGEIVNVRFAIGEYVEIKFEQKIGYFPAGLVRLIEGERWKTAKS